MTQPSHTVVCTECCRKDQFQKNSKNLVGQCISASALLGSWHGRHRPTIVSCTLETKTAKLCSSLIFRLKGTTGGTSKKLAGSNGSVAFFCFSFSCASSSTCVHGTWALDVLVHSPYSPCKVFCKTTDPSDIFRHKCHLTPVWCLMSRAKAYKHTVIVVYI